VPQICPSYTSLYHAVSFNERIGYAEARRRGKNSELWLGQLVSACLLSLASLVLAVGLGWWGCWDRLGGGFA
jgi:hypothetical protein